MGEFPGFDNLEKSKKESDKLHQEVLKLIEETEDDIGDVHTEWLELLTDREWIPEEEFLEKSRELTQQLDDLRISLKQMVSDEHEMVGVLGEMDSLKQQMEQFILNPPKTDEKNPDDKLK